MTPPISAPIKKADLYHTVEIRDAEGNQVFWRDQEDWVTKLS